MDKALVLQLKEVLPYNGQPYFGALELETIKRGDGSGIAKLSFSLLKETSLVIHGGNFYSDSGATILLGTTKKCTVGINEVYLKVSENGVIVFRDITAIEKLGLLNNVRLLSPVGDYGANHPQTKLNIGRIPSQIVHLDVNGDMTVTYGSVNTLSKTSAMQNIIIRGTVNNPSLITGSFENIGSDNLDTVYLSNISDASTTFNIDSVKPKTLQYEGSSYPIRFVGDLSSFVEKTTAVTIPDYFSGITGNLASLKNKEGMTILWLQYNKIITGSLNDLPSSLTQINFLENENITYSGGRTWANNYRLLYLGTPFPSSTIDMILIELADVQWHPTLTKFVILKGTRTSASDAAVTTLINKGVVITFK